MKNTKNILEEYLKKIGQLDNIQLGNNQNKEATEEDSSYLKNLLEKQLKFNNKIILLAISMLLIVFLLNIFGIVYFLNQKTDLIQSIFGSTFNMTLFFTIINWLRRLWIEKSFLDITLTIAQDMKPREASKYIGTMYWKIVNKEK